MADKAVLGLCELLALLFGLPFGEDLYNEKPVTWPHGLYLAIGLIFAVVGPIFPWIRTRAWVPESVSGSFTRAALDARFWIGALMAIFLVSVAPDVYRRAIQPAVATGAIGVMPIGSAPVRSPAPPSSDALQFYRQLAKFVRSNVDEIRDGIYRVDQALFTNYDTMQGNGPQPLHSLFAQLVSVTVQRSIETLDASTQLASEQINGPEVVGYLQMFMAEYARWQDNVLAFQRGAGLADTPYLEEAIAQLQKADERAFGNLRDLKALDPKGPKLDENLLASRNGFFVRWREQIKK
jgi:hypothetical protein